MQLKYVFSKSFKKQILRVVSFLRVANFENYAQIIFKRLYKNLFYLFFTNIFITFFK